MAISYTNELTRKVKALKVDSPGIMAMADLMALGWDEMDAYIVAFNPPMTSNETFIKNRVKAILRSKAFKEHKSDRIKAMNATIMQQSGTISTEATDKFEPLSKDGVLQQLHQLLSITPLDNIKDRSDILKQISDLQRYKDDISESSSNTKHYYLPKKCYGCEWYKGRERDKIK